MAGGELTARGWRPIRRHHVLKRPVSVADCPDPEPPPGVTVRRVASPADKEIAFRLKEDAFAAHFDHQPRTYEQWLNQLDAENLDWSLVWIASLDGVDVAMLLARNRESMGWVRNVGVVGSARGRGLGTFLLRTAFAEFARRGRDTVGLGVDTENATGALRLYEGLGMTLHFAADTWELRLPNG
jgi:ribosomal protein S18 acetylase RimI-like enzyme